MTTYCIAIKSSINSQRYFIVRAENQIKGLKIALLEFNNDSQIGEHETTWEYISNNPKSYNRSFSITI